MRCCGHRASRSPPPNGASAEYSAPSPAVTRVRPQGLLGSRRRAAQRRTPQSVAVELSELGFSALGWNFAGKVCLPVRGSAHKVPPAAAGATSAAQATSDFHLRTTHSAKHSSHTSTFPPMRKKTLPTPTTTIRPPPSQEIHQSQTPRSRQAVKIDSGVPAEREEPSTRGNLRTTRVPPKILNDYV